MDVIAQLVAHRERLGVSQAELARRTGLKQQQINRMERAQRPNLITLGKCCRALGCELKIVPIDAK